MPSCNGQCAKFFFHFPLLHKQQRENVRMLPVYDDRDSTRFATTAAPFRMPTHAPFDSSPGVDTRHHKKNRCNEKIVTDLQIAHHFFFFCCKKREDQELRHKRESTTLLLLGRFSLSPSFPSLVFVFFFFSFVFRERA